MSFFGPKLITMSNTSILNSTFAVRSTETLLLNNTRMENVKWFESNVRNVDIKHNSSSGLILNKCKALKDKQKVTADELYCSDTNITISKDSNVSYRFQKEVWILLYSHDSTTE